MVEDVPAHCREVGLGDLYRSLPTHSMISVTRFLCGVDADFTGY